MSKMSRSLKFLAAAFCALMALNAGAALSDTSSPPVIDWQGSYGGLDLGGAWNDFNGKAGVAGPSGTGGSVLGGGFGGYSWQSGNWVFGGEGDFSVMDLASETADARFKEDWMLTLRGRAGYAIDRYMPYVTAGFAVTDTTPSIGAVSVANMVPGVTAGAGIDTYLSGNWFARLEYLYTYVPEATTSVAGVNVSGGSNNNTLRLGVGYKF